MQSAVSSSDETQASANTICHPTILHLKQLERSYANGSALVTSAAAQPLPTSHCVSPPHFPLREPSALRGFGRASATRRISGMLLAINQQQVRRCWTH